MIAPATRAGGPQARPRGAGGAPLAVIKLSSYPPGAGGGELQTHALSQALRHHGVQVRVIDTRGEGGPRCARLDRVPVLRYRVPGWRLLDAALQHARLRALLRRLAGASDLIQVNHLGPALLAALACRRASHLPVILVPWGSCRPGVGPFRRGPTCGLLRAAGRRADAVVALSQGMQDLLVRLWGFSAAKVRVIPNGVDTARFTTSATLSTLPGVAGGAPVVITVGRLVAAKEHLHLLRAWRAVQHQHPQARLVILGEGPLRQALADAAAELQVASSVLLPGHQDDVKHWLGGASIYVSSSSTEGMSNAVLEAMAAGLPVVATRVSGSEDLIEDGNSGRLVAPADTADLSRALNDLLARPALGRQMGARARATIDAGYSLTAVAGRYRELYDDLCAAGGRR